MSVPTLKMVSPGGFASRPGLSVKSAKGPVSRILSCAVIPLGAALPRTLISDLPGGFGDCIEQPKRALRSAKSRLGASGRCAMPPGSGEHFPPYLVLLRVGFTLPPALPPERCALTAPFHPYPGRTGRPGEPEGPFRMPSSVRGQGGVAEAVSFLWHWPSMGFEAHVPDVIRHTALRSSDFPPPANLDCAKKPAATARSSCQSIV